MCDSGRGASVDLSRRTLLAGTCGALSLAGCLGTDSPPEATSLAGDSTTCDVCGMVIPSNPGPNAQIFYADERPNGHANPARFDTAWEAFQFDFERADRGWTRRAFHVTDYSAVDYEIFEDGGTFVSSHPDAAAFAPVDEVTFVVDSGVRGAMGADLVGFSSRDDADSFRSDHGGELVSADDVTPTLVARLGR